MKNKLFLSVLTLIVMIGNILVAQPQPPSKEKIIKNLTERLNLSSSQIEKVKLIFIQTEKEMQPGGERPQLETMKAVMEKQDGEIEKILTGSQIEEFYKMKKERENRRPPAGGERERPQN